MAARFRTLRGAPASFGAGAVLLVLVLISLGSARGAIAADPCGTGSNPVACENSKPGNPPSDWQVGNGDPTIQGFATQMSVTPGSTINFKIQTDARAYTIDLYRLGYYGGMGARKWGSITPSAPLPQSQPACLFDSSTKLTDCGNWAVSASWAVPTNAVSGVYIAVMTRADTGGQNEITFVVRDDSSHSAMLFQTSDETWQAYNAYGGYSLYSPSLDQRAYKVSYNRPFNSSGNFLFDAEYSMLRWLEMNGYDVSYFSGSDTSRFGSELLNHKIFLSVGHDEYVEGTQRNNIVAARDAGVNLAFFSGNEMFWKTRWENSIDGSSTPYRTMVCYKETLAGAKIDPSPQWTGTWRDPRFSPPADGGRPENAVTGTLFAVNGYRADAIQVPASYGNLRFWRNTAISHLSAGQTYTMPIGTLGYEWDQDTDNGFRPAGLFDMSSTTVSVPALLQDYGGAYAAGTGTHSLTMYRAASGALVFGAGTVQWSWGLDSDHSADAGTPQPPDQNMQQATVNLFADMGVQPATMQSNLTPATQSTDTTPPTSTITAPANGATIQNGGSTVTISGTASDTGGVVAGVEISTDGGTTWHRASGLSSWSYQWPVSGFGQVTIKVRAIDDSGNIQSTPTSITVNVSCPCSIFTSGATPAVTSTGDSNGVELGVKFRSDINGYIGGIRFYKGSGNTGQHYGSLWSSGGTLLARAPFSGETASGWQTVMFDNPVAVTANTTYIASYYAPAGHYAVNNGFFTTAGFDSPPLHALKDGLDGANGVYSYGSAPSFPTSTYQSANYWVDVVLETSIPPDTTPPQVVSTSPATGSSTQPISGSISASFSEGLAASSVTATNFTLKTTSSGTTIPATVTYNAPTRQAILTPSSPLTYSTNYTATVRGGSGGVTDIAGNPLAANYTWSFTTLAPPSCPCSIWSSVTTPGGTSSDPNSVELGVKFRAETNGSVTGIRFYKGAGNTGTHVGDLWTSTGQLLARATFTNETASGWQTVTFAQPVPIRSGNTYVASYLAPAGHYSENNGYFAAGETASPPLYALQDGGAGGGNGVYVYSTTPAFPSSAYQATNYWVDVVFNLSTTTDTTPPTVSSTSPASGATGAAPNGSVTATFSEAMDPSSISSSTFRLVDSSNNPVPASVSYDLASHTATLTPTTSLAYNAGYTATIQGGASGVSDVAGNALAANYSWSFTTGGPSCPCSIWSSTATPATASSPDPNSAELGVKFRTDVPGYITGIRFYKGATNTGTHVGDLWTSTGTLLAEATFSGESASGWQTVTFDQPVPVNANTTYVASYLAPTGNYALNQSYFATSGVDNGPLHALKDGTDGGNGVYLYTGTPAFPNKTSQSSNYWVDVVFTTSAPNDTTPPTVTGNSPASGATSAPITGSVTATFSEAMNATTVTGSTFRLVDSSNNVVPATVSYNASTRTATLTPSSALANGASYTATVVGGAPGVKDLAGNALAANYSWSFTTASIGCPCSIWSTAATPATASSPDPNSVELGVKFRTDAAGYITGIRFYKGATNTGTHVGDLWTSTGSLLARATFTNETATGWQTVTFDQPVAVSANTTYVASYLAPNGNYALNQGYFAASGVDNTPLHALRDGTDGGNGVYLYTGTPAFPNRTSQSSNYWVDVLFTMTAPADTTPPTVASTTPAGGATGVATSATVKATFSEAVQASTVSTSTFTVVDAANNSVAGSVAYDAGTRTATFTPSSPLAFGTTYTATIKGGSSGVKDLAGNAMASDFSWSFTAQALNCPCSIWTTSTTPATAASPDPNSVELGVKFRSDVAGFITGIRFYKGATNTGTHVGDLWSSTGTLLAEATFIGESATGWQTVTFAQPVPINANTTYVASYLAPNGNYALNQGFFATTGVDNTPLHALADGLDGGDGVYLYSATPAFPNKTSQSSNYWVDVIFTTTSP